MTKSWRRGWLVTVVVALACAGAFVGWRRLAVPPVPFNVVVVLVDTLRADHLSGYGYHRPTSPNLDRFFADGAIFRGARAQASCTYPSVNSLLTSRYPAPFLAQPEKRMGIPEGMPTIASVLRENGYSTIALSASPIVRKTGTKYNNHGGFDGGFDVFDERCMWREARCLNENLLPHLEQAREPFFVYLHYMDPHDPYRPPSWYRKRYSADYEGLDFVAAGNPNPIADAIRQQRPLPDYRAADLQHLIDLYDDEITYFDGEFAVLMGYLGSRGLLERTIVVLAADHGEQFLEHGFMKHCLTLYDTDIGTPLAFRVPGSAGGLEVAAPVQNVDVMPTLLDYAGIDVSDLALDGRSLRPWIDGSAPESDRPDYAFAMQGGRRSIVDETFKLGFDARTRRFEMHDLRRDPLEVHDVLNENSEAFVRLEQALHAWETQVAEGKTSADLLRAGEEVQERLRALGYLQ